MLDSNHRLAELRRSALMSICVFVLFQGICHADDPDARDRISGLRGEFAIGKQGRLILLPVEAGGKKRQFMVDTGACRTGFDIGLRDLLGEPRGSQILRTPAGRSRVRTYDWPDAMLGGQPLKTERLVAGIDLTELRQASNENIQGIIGMDVLKNCRMQIDFDGGIVRFLDSLPKRREEFGVRIPIDMSNDDVPCIVGTIFEDESEPFLIDTGAQGNSLRPERFDELVGRRQIRLGGSFTSITVGGEVQGSRGFLRQLSVGPIVLNDLRMSRVEPSSLGLRYFSRFVVTYDFPDRAIYLRKSASFSKSEPLATSGMSLVWIDGAAIIKAVKASGPAGRIGVQVNDAIVRIDGRKITDYDHFSLRQLLTSEPGKVIPIAIRRDGREIKFELTLDED